MQEKLENKMFKFFLFFQEVKHAVPFNDIANSNPEWESMMKEKSHISSYIAGGFVSLLLLIVLTIALLR